MSRRRPIHPLRERDPAHIGAWIIEGRIGAGGMGVVYLARRADGSVGALKVIADHLVDQEGFRTRFAREIDILRRVEGPGLARVLDADPSADPPFVVTEFVDAANLHEHIQTHGPLPEGSWTRLAGGLLQAVGAIHAKGVLHRDIKPSNVLLAESGPMLIDFGIAAAEDNTTLTAPQMLLGTPEWLAPERMSGAAASPASDIFSLGGLLAYAGTGRAPFAAPSPAETMQRVVQGKADLTGLPPAQAHVVTAMLAPDPAARPTPALAADMLGVEQPSATVQATLIVPQQEAATEVLAEGASVPDSPSSPAKGRPWRTVAIIAGVLVAVGMGLLVASWLTGPVGTQDISTTCDWAEVDDFGDSGLTSGNFAADCEGTDLRADGAVRSGSSGLLAVEYRLTGTIGELALSISSSNGLDWDGTLGGAAVRLLGSRDDDLSFSVLPGSTIGQASVQCAGPAPSADDRESGIGQNLVWDNPSTVEGTFSGDDRVSSEEAGSLCNLVLVGVPASRLGDLGS